MRQEHGKGTQALTLNTVLTSLKLPWNQVTDAGAKALALNTSLTFFKLDE
jgi:hypothetical protein